MGRIIVIARGNERDRAAVLDLIRVRVDAFVQLWRNTQGQRPEKRCGNERRDESAAAIWRTRVRVHCDATFCLLWKLRKGFLQDWISQVLGCWYVEFVA